MRKWNLSFLGPAADVLSELWLLGYVSAENNAEVDIFKVCLDYRLEKAIWN